MGKSRRWDSHPTDPDAPFGGNAKYIFVGLTAVAAIALTVIAFNVTRPAVSNAQPGAIPTFSSPPSMSHPSVAFFGDSYTAGTGSTTQAQRFTTVLSALEGWSEVNLGQGGTGYSSAVTGSGAQNACGLSLCPSYDGMIAAAATAKPRIVVVSGGRNEASHDPALIVAGISKFFSDLHAALPDAKIYATSPLWDATPPPAALRLIAQSVRDSVTAAGGTYLDIGQPLTGKPDLIIPDGIHPNDAGHAAIAAAIVATYPAPAKKP